MAVTNEKSVQISNTTAFPPVKNPAYNWRGRVRFLYFKHVQGAAAGDINSTADLVVLPQGSVRVIAHLSKVYFKGNTALTTMDIGTRAYKDLAGVTVAESAQRFVSAFAVGAGTVNTDLSESQADAGTFPDHVLPNQNGVTVFAKVAGAVWAIGATTEGVIAYVLD